MKRLVLMLFIVFLASCEVALEEVVLPPVLDETLELVEQPIESEDYDDESIHKITISIVNTLGRPIETLVHDLREPFDYEFVPAEGQLMSGWLNAGRSITLPAVFTEDQEIVADVYSESLIFQQWDFGYRVTGMTNLIEETLVIPHLYLGRIVHTIHDEAFRNSLIDVVQIPSTIRVIGERAFTESTVREVRFSNQSQLHTIAWDAFSFTSSLTRIELPEGVQNLSQGVFYYSNIEEIYLPSTLRSMARYVFTHSMNLRHIEVHPNNPIFSSRDGILYRDQGTTLVFAPIQLDAREIIVPEGVKNIVDYAFENNSKQSISLPSTLISVAKDAFSFSRFQTIQVNSIDTLRLLINQGIIQTTLSQVVVPSDIYNEARTLLSRININVKTAEQLSELALLPEVISLFTNAWIESPLGLNNAKPLEDWRSVSTFDQVIVYLYAYSDALVNIELRGSTLTPITHRFEIENDSRIISWENRDRVILLSEVSLSKGYNRIILQGFSTSPNQANFTIRDFAVFSTTEEPVELSYSPDTFRTNPPYLTMWHRIPSNEPIEWIYSEILVEEGNDILYTYSVANGFAGGYFGMQSNTPDPTRRWILFSIWSPFETDDPRLIPTEYRVRVKDKGENVVLNDFGNEGSGQQSYLEYPWVTGVSYGFLTGIRPISDNYTQYESYFYDPTLEQWFYIATMERPFTQTYVRDYYSFLEVYLSFNAATQRSTIYNNYWARTANGEWLQVASSNLIPNNNTAFRRPEWFSRYDYDGIMIEQGVELTTGGFKLDKNFRSRTFNWSNKEFPAHLIEIPFILND